MTDITLGDRTVSLPDLPRLDLPRPDVSLPDLPIKDLSLPELSLPDISLPDLRRRSSASPSTLPMVLLTLAAGLMLGIVLAALAWTLAPVRETAQRIRGRFSGPSWTKVPEHEYLENALAGRPRERDDEVVSEPSARSAASSPAAAAPSTTPKTASPNGSTAAGHKVSPRSTVALDPGQP